MIGHRPTPVRCRQARWHSWWVLSRTWLACQLALAAAPRRGITASVRLPWTLPAVPALPLAGSAACWLVTGVRRSVPRVGAWVDNRGGDDIISGTGGGGRGRACAAGGAG